MKFGGAHGAKFMSGRLNYALERGAMLQLRKASNGEWQLLALSGDGRHPSTDPQTVFSFCLPSDDELTAMRIDQRTP